MKTMSDNRIEGAVRKGAGRVQAAAGALTGDTETELRGKLNDAAGSAQNAFGKVQDKAEDAFEEARDRAQVLRGRLNDAADVVQNAYGTAIDQADGLVGDAQARAEAVYAEAKTYIREKPLMAVGLGMLAGVLLWHMLGANRKVIYVREK
jgi:uncharacterized protein YjbJ (UPF0337 family)